MRVLLSASQILMLLGNCIFAEIALQIKSLAARHASHGSKLDTMTLADILEKEAYFHVKEPRGYEVSKHSSN